MRVAEWLLCTHIAQVGPDDLRRNALMQLLVHLAKRDAFYTLRTQEQLGYIVAMFNMQEMAVNDVRFVLQSNGFSAAHLASRTEAFIHKFCSGLAGGFPSWRSLAAIISMLHEF